MSEELIDVKLGGRDEEGERRELGLEEFLESNKLTLGFLVLGIILIGAGLLGLKIFDFTSNQPKVEILGTTEGGEWKVEAGTKGRETGADKITVEAAGEVMKPGVYEMAAESRINDLLTAAGGLSAEADREWVSKNINLAQKLADGVKIYIPKKGKGVGEIGGVGNIGEKININTASEAELDTLWGVGPTTAKKIIEGRPYLKPEELLQKKIIKSNVWEKIKEEITTY